MDLETQSEKQKSKYEILQTEFGNSLRMMQGKLSNVEESGEIRTFVTMVNDDTIDLMRKGEILTKESLNLRIDKIYADNMLVPGLIGDYEKYDTLREWI